MRQILVVIAVVVLLPVMCLAEQYLAYPLNADYDPPVKYFDPYPGFPTYPGHEGTDFDCPYYTPLYAPIGGQVTIHDGESDGSSAPGCTEAAGYGNYIIITSGTRRVRLAHCANGGFAVANGATVSQGQLIARSSNSGYTCGSDDNGSFYHLHLQLDILENGQWIAKNPYVLDGGVWITPRVYGGSTPHYEIALPTSQEGGAQFVNGQLANEVTLTPGQTAHFTVRYKNLCNFTWSKNQADPNWVGLMSCRSNGSTVCHSFLNDPWNSSLGWMTDADHAHVTSFNEASIPHDVIATFEFDVYIPEGTDPVSDTSIYFSLHHATHGFISNGWGGLSFQVTVAPTGSATLYGDDFTSFTGCFNGDNKADIALWNRTNGSVHVALRDPQSNRFIPSASPWLANWADGATYDMFIADFSGDGYDDICVRHKTLGRWFIAYNWGDHFTAAIGPGTGGSWLNGWGAGSNFEPFVGDFSGDGYTDIGVREISTGRWFVAYNWGGYFQQKNGPGPNGSWLSGWATGANYKTFVGDYSGDGYDEVCVRYAPLGRWSVAYNQTNVFQSAGTWIDGWATGSGYVPFVGQLSIDDYTDIGAYYPSLGRWFVGWNQGGYFQQKNGSGTSGSWLNGWAVEDGSLNWECHVADVSGDGWDDLVVYTPEHGRWFVAYNWGTHVPPEFVSAAGPFANNSWLNSWGVETGGSPKLAEGESQEILPSFFTLHQNYPNPFNPMTTISYNLPVTSDVRLDIFNILGQRVETLVDERQSAGEHSVLWNSAGFSSGVYFYRLQTGEATETKKMILLK